LTAAVLHCIRLLFYRLRQRSASKRGSDAAEVDLDEYYDPELKEPAVKTVAQAVRHPEQLTDFAQYYGHEELSFRLSKFNDILHEIKLRAPKYQKTLTDSFFLLEINIVTLQAFPDRET